MQRYMPSEWAPSKAVMLSWPHALTDWAYMLDEVTQCFVDIATAIAEDESLLIVAPDIEEPKSRLSHIDPSRVFYAQIQTNDTWARDFGPISVVDADGRFRVCDFKFNGWGLKFAACYDNLINSKLAKAGFFRCPVENRLGFVLEGGSIESDGHGTIMTTSECLLSPNRNGNLTRDDIETYLGRALGARRVLWIEHGYLAGDDTDSHVDTLARFAPDNTIVYVKCDDSTDEHYEALRLMEEDIRGFVTDEGLPYNLIALPMPAAVYDEDGQRLPATYANFLITPRSVLMPAYNQPAVDELARRILQIAFPDHTVKPIQCSPLIKQHGSLHCVTMQMPGEILPI